ncbi:hypothetical protein [Chelativorans sp. AA-79]|uniref:hypothetical protein n=1 Tax=Chelativorans sp. AA-79 TaxID=3028735 RepID=UPI0023FA1C5A|nr:hypothetical protein [Chelativorans sp. AA-79]WEX07896.1 hypothetical protein PVE73_17585 [Chelativorans sp. AA-79]
MVGSDSHENGEAGRSGTEAGKQGERPAEAVQRSETADRKHHRPGRHQNERTGGQHLKHGCR